MAVWFPFERLAGWSNALVNNDLANTRGRSADLMDMVVHMLACNNWCNRVGLFGSCLRAGVLEFHTLFLKTSLDGVGVTVLDLTRLDRGHSVGVLFGENLAIFDWLNGGVVMVLMHLTIDGGLSLFMTLLNDLLVYHSGSNLLVDCGVMMTGLLPEESMHD